MGEGRLAHVGLEGGDAVTVTVEVDVDGMERVETVVIKIETGAVVAIQPPWRFNNPWKDYTDALGMGYGYVLAEGGATDFRLDPDDLLRTLDLAGA